MCCKFSFFLFPLFGYKRRKAFWNSRSYTFRFGRVKKRSAKSSLILPVPFINAIIIIAVTNTNFIIIHNLPDKKFIIVIFLYCEFLKNSVCYINSLLACLVFVIEFGGTDNL